MRESAESSSSARWVLLAGVVGVYAWVALALVWPLPFVGAVVVAGLVLAVAVWRWRDLWEGVRRARRPDDLDLSLEGEVRWKQRQARAVWAIVLLTLAMSVAAVLGGLHARSTGPERVAYLNFSMGLVFVTWLPITPVAIWLTTNRRRRLFRTRTTAFRGRLREFGNERQRRESR